MSLYVVAGYPVAGTGTRPIFPAARSGGSSLVLERSRRLQSGRRTPKDRRVFKERFRIK
jgi:hypothetical protein